MKVGVPKETAPEERRVAATPESVERLIALGFEVVVERGAGAGASFPDAAYEGAGATLVDDALVADVILQVNPPDPERIARLREGQVWISLLGPADRPDLLEALAARKVTAFALDAIPRISRAQKADVLSSMANIAGYRAIVEASHHYGGFFGPQITAAGKSPPARVLVIGAGVAGLAAIAAARGLGADVLAFDTRLAVKDQVRSLGARFLELAFEEDGEGAGGYAKVMSDAFIAAEMAAFREQAPDTDIVVTTALIPGRKAPILWTKDMVEAMKPGSVVVDLAARNGGNCEVTRPGEVVVHAGVTIIGHTDLTSRLPTTASRFFAQNVVHFVEELDLLGGAFDLDNEMVRDPMVTHRGEILWPPPRRPPPEAPKPPPSAPPAPPSAPDPPPSRNLGRNLALLALAAVLAGAGVAAPTEFLQHLTVFVLSCFVGWQVVWNVTPALHTPLMSVTNAISGIIIVGGILQAASGAFDAAALLGAVAVTVAMINVAGGFLVTQRMLGMFRR